MDYSQHPHQPYHGSHASYQAPPPQSATYPYHPPGTQPYQQSQSPQAKQPPHISPKGMWISKLTLRLLSMVFCIVIIGIGATILSDLSALENHFLPDSYYDYDDYDYRYSDFDWTGYPGPLLFLGPPAAVAFAWNLVESICICARGGHRGIHPGACVGIDLILWLGFVGSSTGVALVFYYIFSPYMTYQYPLTTFVFGIIEAAIHFALFVIACCETNVRNRRSTIVYVQNGPADGNGAAFSPMSGPPMATPYSPKEPTTSVAQPSAPPSVVSQPSVPQPSVTRKPVDSYASSPSSRWDQHGVPGADGLHTPELAVSAYPSPETHEIPATYRQDGH